MTGIVLTGGGSQLKNLQQLVSFVTAKETRIGYPNEHLGKSKVDAVKTPVYATSVGLVLSGFRAIDIREDRYNEKQAKNGMRPKSKQGAKFFQNILEKTKGLLIDDFDENKDY